MSPSKRVHGTIIHMKINKLIATLAGLSLCASVSAQSSFSDRFKFAPEEAIYGPKEFSLDAFGGYATRDKNGDPNSAWGYGVGLNYFFSEYYGVGADTYSDAFNWPYQLNVTGILRYPLGKSGFAPYATAGFGRQWAHAAQWFGDIAGGIEYRFNPHTGVFTDFRGVFPENTESFMNWRFGFRLAW